MSGEILTPVTTLPYHGTAQTVANMKSLAMAAQTSWPLRRLVERICARIEPKDYLSELLALYYFACRNVRYMRDPRTVELVKTPDATLATATGDCDDISTLLGAMTMLDGADSRFVTVGFKRAGLSHVFTDAFEPRRQRWVTLDPVAGPNSGAMIRRITNHQFWPIDA